MSTPAEFRGDVLEDALDGVGVVFDAQLVWDSQEQRVGGGDCFVLGKLFDQHVGLGGVRAAENGARVGVDVTDLVLITSVASEVGPVPIVDEREDAAAHGNARRTLVPGLFPGLPVGVNLLALLNVQWLAALVILESRALEVHTQLRRPYGCGVGAGAPPDPVAQ